jgi:hypothetical protein
MKRTSLLAFLALDPDTGNPAELTTTRRRNPRTTWLVWSVITLAWCGTSESRAGSPCRLTPTG